MINFLLLQKLAAMFESIGLILDSILGADFPKVAGLSGLGFIALGVIPGAVALGPIRIPRRDGMGRGTSIFLGAVFVLIPMLGLTYNTTITLTGASAENSVEVIEASPEAGGLLISHAFAATGRYKISARQRSVVNLSKIFRGDPINMYVGDIKLQAPPTIAIFKKSGSSSKIRNGANLNQADIKGLAPARDIFFNRQMNQGGQSNFSVSGVSYTIKLEQVMVSIAGANSVRITLSKQ